MYMLLVLNIYIYSLANCDVRFYQASADRFGFNTALRSDSASVPFPIRVLPLADICRSLVLISNCVG